MSIIETGDIEVGAQVAEPYSPQDEVMKIMIAFESIKELAQADRDSRDHIVLFIDTFRPVAAGLYEHLSTEDDPAVH